MVSRKPARIRVRHRPVRHQEDDAAELKGVAMNTRLGEPFLSGLGRALEHLRGEERQKGSLEAEGSRPVVDRILKQGGA